jgi:hypothetical protein
MQSKSVLRQCEVQRHAHISIRLSIYCCVVISAVTSPSKVWGHRSSMCWQTSWRCAWASNTAVLTRSGMCGHPRPTWLFSEWDNTELSISDIELPKLILVECSQLTFEICYDACICTTIKKQFKHSASQRLPVCTSSNKCASLRPLEISHSYNHEWKISSVLRNASS